MMRPDVADSKRGRLAVGRTWRESAILELTYELTRAGAWSDLIGPF